MQPDDELWFSLLREDPSTEEFGKSVKALISGRKRYWKMETLEVGFNLGDRVRVKTSGSDTICCGIRKQIQVHMPLMWP